MAVHAAPREGVPLDSNTKPLADNGQESSTLEPERAILKLGATLEAGTPSRIELFE